MTDFSFDVQKKKNETKTKKPTVKMIQFIETKYEKDAQPKCIDI